jgi:hypothetical protein
MYDHMMTLLAFDDNNFIMYDHMMTLLSSKANNLESEYGGEWGRGHGN